jgi:hypothetical protein
MSYADDKRNIYTRGGGASRSLVRASAASDVDRIHQGIQDGYLRTIEEDAGKAPFIAESLEQLWREVCRLTAGGGRMKQRGFWFLITATCLALGSWLLVLSLLDASAVGAAPGDHTAFPDASTGADIQAAFEPTAFDPDSAVSLENPYPCTGVWVTQTVDSTGDVGQYTSLALEATYPYTPHISYHDVTSDNLKYAWLSAVSWLSETIDSGGRETSLALVPTYPYTPCISYYDHWGWALRYACRDGMTWIVSHVEGKRAGLLGTSLALEPTYPYTPHISYYLPFGFYDLVHTYWNDDHWEKETVDGGGVVGTRSSLALEPTYPYTPHVSYRYWDNLDLRHACLSGTTWFTETVDSEGDVGDYTSLALDSSGNPHISYLDHTHGALKYAWLSGTVWFSETVPSTGYTASNTSLELDRSDHPFVCYYDAISDELRLASFDGTVWITQTVDSTGDVGQFCSLELDGRGCPHISYYDATNGDLKYAYIMVEKHRLYLPLVLRSGP